MSIINKLLLPIVFTLILIGIAVQNIRQFAIPTGLGLLVIAYALEKIFSRNNSYRISDLLTRSVVKGIITATNTHLLISDKWDINSAIKILGLNGDYRVVIEERFKGEFSLISSISFENDTYRGGKVESNSVCVSVDTGWLLFLLGSNSEQYSSNDLQKLIQNELKRLPNHKPLCFWLKNDGGKNIGIIVSTGEGDGTYSINHKRKEGKLTMIKITFISR